MSSTVPVDLRKVIIKGLQKAHDVQQDGWTVTKDDEHGGYTLSINLHENELVWNRLWDEIQAYGFAIPASLFHGTVEYEKLTPLYTVREHDEVLVVADDQPSTPTTIKISETLISHANTHHVPPIEFHSTGPTSECELQDDRGFRVTFERTTRIPDDNKLHHLPASIGRYELFSVDAYSKHLPKNFTDVGGVFFSMWQREAMWINFPRASVKYAVRVFVGHVNAITGQEMQNEQEAKDQNGPQDYIIIPDQRWLDGICVAPGVVRQFVAMPLGSGYTVEGQKTSEEKHGGLQLEITPEMVQHKRFWSYAKQQYITYRATGNLQTETDGLDERRTPHELGCKVGDTLKSYPTEMRYRQPFQIHDLVVSQALEDRESNASKDYSSLLASTITLEPYYPEYIASGARSAKRVIKKPRNRGSVRPSGLQSAPAAHSPAQATPAQATPAQYGPTSPYAPVLYESAAYASAATELSVSLPPQAARSSQSVRSDFQLHEEDDEMMFGPQAQGHNDQVCDLDFEPLDQDKTDLIESTEVQAKNVKTLGLAAGGKLIQDIYRDPYPATTWNHAAARILHVHMIDPESCEKVTHIVPKPPPMSVEDYTKSGGQFFVVEEKVNERLDGGDFDNVKSISQMDEHLGISTEPEFDPTKPKMCTTCERRLCDCIIRPCNHQFCNICIKRLDQSCDTEPSAQSARHWKCPTCDSPVSHVAGFSAPMNLPGEERLLRTKVPVHVLKIEDGRARFSSIQTSRV